MFPKALKISEIKDHKITISDRGITLTSPKKSPGNCGKKNIRKRGKITRFSKASRRRLRKTMMEKFPVFEKICCATFTIPIELYVCQESALWKSFQSDFLSKHDLAVIWRREITRKGRSHWHCIIGYPYWFRPVRLASEWVERLEKLGFYLPSGTGDHAVKIDQSQESKSCWLRYMMDHASKHKSYQELKEGGRHWGIIGRKHFKEKTAQEIYENEETYFRMVRFMRRMLAYRRNGKIIRRKGRGYFGRTDWFMKDSQIKSFERYLSYIS